MNTVRFNKNVHKSLLIIVQTGSNLNIYQAKYDTVIQWNTLRNKDEQATYAQLHQWIPKIC